MVARRCRRCGSGRNALPSEFFPLRTEALFAFDSSGNRVRCAGDRSDDPRSGRFGAGRFWDSPVEDGEECSSEQLVGEFQFLARCCGARWTAGGTMRKSAWGRMAGMRISTKVDYAIRALIEIARLEPGQVAKAEDIAKAQSIPRNFSPARRSAPSGNAVEPSGKPEAGTSPALPMISIADVIRATDGPLVSVHGVRPRMSP